MSAQDELPPGWEYTTAPSNEAVARGPVGLSAWTAAPGHRQCAKDAWRLWSRASGITREELATMRAAVERCAELERLVDDAEHGRATALTVRDAQAERCSKAEAALAKVTAERDAGRERLLCACTYVDLERNGNERDMARLLAVPRYELPALLSDALNVNWICRERATPTEGD